VIHRHLQKLGIDCLVVAPSKMPVPGGKRQKTDRRDAELLARLLRAGELSSIAVPDAVDESVRDLTRTRSDAVDDLRRAKQRLKSFLLRQGYHYQGTADWSAKHLRYLRHGLPAGIASATSLDASRRVRRRGSGGAPRSSSVSPQRRSILLRSAFVRRPVAHPPLPPWTPKAV
jgi:transposase